MSLLEPMSLKSLPTSLVPRFQLVRAEASKKISAQGLGIDFLRKGLVNCRGTRKGI